MPILNFLLLVLTFAHNDVLSCDQVDHDSLRSFQNHISFSPSAPLHWYSTDCCQWEGIVCDHNRRVTRLSLSGRGLSGSITPFLGNLSSLTHINLSHNHLSGPLPITLFHHLKTLDFSFNLLSSFLQPSDSDTLPLSVEVLDLSSNHFNGTIDHPFLHKAFNLVHLNASNNSFTGPLPVSVCSSSNLLETLDFSMNQFSGHVFPGLSKCSRLKVFRAGFNFLSGQLPFDIYSIKSLRELSLHSNHFSGSINNSIGLLSNLRILELHVNEITGEIPHDIGQLSNLKQFLLHTNSLTGSVPSSLTNCTGLRTLLLRNNLLGGQISSLDFTKLQHLRAIDFGNNSFVGNIPSSLCLCRSLTAIRLAYNQLDGEVPPCMVSLKSLSHLSLSNNFLSNVSGALRILMHCDNLSVLFLSRCFHGEMMPDDYSLLHITGFQNLQILTLGGCELEGQIPSWISKLRNLKVLNLSYNKISGPIPTWLGSFPSLFVLNLTTNSLTGELPREICSLPALISDETGTDLSYLALPFLFDSLQYNRLFNLPRGIKVGNNSLTGNIPAEIGKLKLLQVLDLSQNKLEGHIPDQLSHLFKLEKLDMSQNHLSGKIPESLAKLNFLSSFSVANNNLEGEVPRGGQFDTFPLASFEGNPRLCGPLLRGSCPDMSPMTQVDATQEDEIETECSWYNVPFGMGYFVGFFVVSITLLFSK